MNVIIIAILAVTTMGGISAVLLCIASKVMYVKVDENLTKLQECLPGANCGACGYPGCAGYAKALLDDSDVKTNLCTPGGADVVAKISALLGVAAEDVVKKAAIVHCLGDCNAKPQKMEYKGIETCEAASKLFGGAGACAFGCLGYGDCKVVCPEGAICIEDGLARIDRRLCTGCGLCVKECPNKLIAVKNYDIPVSVLCKNLEKGAVARKKCSNACISCGKCVRECPEKAIVITDNLAVIDFEKCTGCGHCVEVCITKCIKPIGIKDRVTVMN